MKRPILYNQDKSKPFFVFSQANRIQLFSVIMAESLVVIYEDMSNPPDKIMIHIKQCKSIIKQIRKQLHGNGEPRFKKKDIGKYFYILGEIVDAIDDEMGYEKKLSLDYISGILTIVVEQYEKISKYSKKKDYIKIWAQLVETIQNIYEFYDSNMEYSQCHNNGQILYEKFIKAQNL